MLSIIGDSAHIAASSCLPQYLSFSLPSSITKTLRQYFLKKTSFTAFSSLALCISQQTQVWVTQIHFLCLGRWFSLGEVNMSFKPLQKPPFRQCPASSKINTKTSLTPDGPRHGTVPKHYAPARHLIHYISASVIQKSWSQLLPYKVPYPVFAINCLSSCDNSGRGMILIVFKTHNLTIRC